MSNFVFITDLHLKTSTTVRNGDLLEDFKTKLQFVVDYANACDATILIGGDIFDRPSVPDIVKNTIAPVLLGAVHTPITIFGNHDLLYNSEEYLVKTSYETWVTHGIIRPVDNSTIRVGDVFITNEVPVINRGAPQIVLFHGFLNKEDGRNTFRFQDISSEITDQVYVLLGHDHTPFDPLEFSENIKIFRPGSFGRVSREDASYRMPVLLHIRVKDGRLQFKNVVIKTARPAEEVFNVKLTDITKAQQQETYDSIINQIRNANVNNMTLEQALQQVAPEDVCEYASRLLTENRIKSQHERSNL